MVEPLAGDKLLDLYKIAIEEYRFEVRLGWDRTTYFLVLNSAILTVATGLLKFDNPPIVYLFISLLFIFGFVTSLIGSRSITMAHEYYRRAVVKKTVIEQRLGLISPLPDMHHSLNFAVGTTRGQIDRLSILNDPEAWIDRPHRRSAITFWLRWILRGMAIVDGFGFAVGIVFFILHQNFMSMHSIAPPHSWLRLL
jgi:hypothetical protein